MKVYKTEVSSFATNCYFAVNEAIQEGIIVDPGAEVEQILAMIKQANAKCVAIFLTHGHSDHIGALNDLRKETGADVYVSAKDKKMLSDARSNLSLFFGDNIKCAEPEHVIDGDEHITVAGMEFDVMATPGHTPGGICFYNKESNMLFAGDTIFCESIGRTDFPGGSYKEILNSIKTKILVLPEDTNILPGHGPTSTVGWERRRNPFLQ